MNRLLVYTERRWIVPSLLKSLWWGTSFGRTPKIDKRFKRFDVSLYPLYIAIYYRGWMLVVDPWD